MASAPASTFRLRFTRSTSALGASWWTSGYPPHQCPDRGGACDQRHQFVAVRKTTSHRGERFLAFGWITPQRHDVGDSPFFGLTQPIQQGFDGGTHTSKVSHHRNLVAGQNVRTDVERLALGGPSRAIGTRNEPGLVLDQTGHMLFHGLPGGIRFGWVNFKRKTKRPEEYIWDKRIEVNSLSDQKRHENQCPAPRRTFLMTS